MGKRPVYLGVGLLIAAGVAGVGGVFIPRQVSQLKEVGISIAREEAVKRKAGDEREKLQEEIDRAMQEVDEIPDSLKATRMGTVMGESASLRKAGALIDQKELRAEKRLEHLGRERDVIKGRLMRWGVILGVAEMVLVAAMIVVLRRAPK